MTRLQTGLATDPPAPVPAARAPRGLRRIVFAMLAVGLSLTFTFAVAELGVRLFVPRVYWEVRNSLSDWNLHPNLGWVQKPNLDITTQNLASELVRFHTNADGLRPADAVRDKAPGTLRAMIFGDSTVVGRAVPEEQTLHVHLQRILGASDRPVDVINAGVQAWSNDQELLWMEELIPVYRPDVVVLGICDNDFGGNVLPRAYGMNKPMFELAPDGHLGLVPCEPNANVAAPQSSGLAGWMGCSALYRSLRPKITVLRAKLGRWEDRNLLGLPNEAYYRPAALERYDWRLFRAILTRMEEVCETNGARLILFLHPAANEVWKPQIENATKSLGLAPGEYDPHALEKRVAETAADAGVEFCPLIDEFVAHPERGPFHLLPRDPHCNGRGYQLTAEVLASHIGTSQSPIR